MNMGGKCNTRVNLTTIKTVNGHILTRTVNSCQRNTGDVTSALECACFHVDITTWPHPERVFRGQKLKAEIKGRLNVGTLRTL
jgi:hypothetical protein